MQANDSIMSGYFCIGFINFMLKNKGLLSYPKFNKCRKILKIYCIQCNKYRKTKKPNMSYIFDKTLVLTIIFQMYGCHDGKIFKENNQLRF